MIGGIGRAGLGIPGIGLTGERRSWDFANGNYGPFASFARTGAGTAITQAGVVRDFATGVPRITDRGLLLEGAAKNLLLRSQEFENASWGKQATGTGATPMVTPNAAAAPDGTMTADRIAMSLSGGNSAGDRSYLTQAVTVSAGAHTLSPYVKGVAGERILVRSVGGFGYLVHEFNGAWQRIERTETASGGVIGIEAFGLRGTFGVTDTVTFDAWGADLETGAKATSYIPTTTAAATRGADSASLTVPPGCTDWEAEYGASGTTGGAGLTPGDPFDLTTGRPWIGLNNELKRVRFL